MKKRVFNLFNFILGLAIVLSIIYVGDMPLASGESKVRVLLASGISSTSISVVEGEYYIYNSVSGEQMGSLKTGDILNLNRQGSEWTIKINDKSIGKTSNFKLYAGNAENCILKYGSNQYRDSLQVGKDGKIVNLINVEYYLYSVVGKEIGYSAAMEAMKAQAVASRSYVNAFINEKSEYDIDKSSQTYVGYQAELVAGWQKVREAVDATKGQVMYYRDPVSGKEIPVQAYYHSHSGGHTEDAANVWGTDVPYLQGVPSPTDSAGGSMSWNKTYTAKEIETLMTQYIATNKLTGSFGTFKSITAYSLDLRSSGQSASGRVTKIVVVGSNKTIEIYRDQIRSAFGGLKSTLFQISSATNSPDTPYVIDAYGNLTKLNTQAAFGRARGNQAQDISIFKQWSIIGKNGQQKTYVIGSKSIAASEGNITFTGQGNGHGVGMSQWGAIGMAEAGYSYIEILNYYYSGGSPENLRIRHMDN